MPGSFWFLGIYVLGYGNNNDERTEMNKELVDFLLARIEEDEEFARHTNDSWERWRDEACAKRAMVEAYQTFVQVFETTDDFRVKVGGSGCIRGLEIALKVTAQIYRNHEEYMQDWSTL